MHELHVETDFVTLETGDGIVTLVQAPAELVEQYAPTDPKEPVERREGNPIKISFPVGNIAAARERAALHGGSLDLPETEWQYGLLRVCDGVDPEGNVIQVRQLAP